MSGRMMWGGWDCVGFESSEGVGIFTTRYGPPMISETQNRVALRHRRGKAPTILGLSRFDNMAFALAVDLLSVRTAGIVSVRSDRTAAS